MQKTFNLPVRGREATNQLLCPRQGGQLEYAITFCILAAETSWDQAVLQGMFLRGLLEEVEDELAVCDDSPSLDALINLAVCPDNRLREQNRERKEKWRAHFPSPVPRAALVVLISPHLT